MLDSTLGRCDACMRIDFKNAAQDRDLMCLKEQGRGSCIFTGNLLGDRSFFSVTATNEKKCSPFSDDPLEVNFILSKNKTFVNAIKLFLHLMTEP